MSEVGELDQDIQREVESARSRLGTYVWVGQKYYIDLDDIPPTYGSREYSLPNRRKPPKGIEHDPNGRLYALRPLDPNKSGDDNVAIRYGKVYVNILEGINAQTGEKITSWVNFNEEPQRGRRGFKPKRV